MITVIVLGVKHLNDLLARPAHDANMFFNDRGAFVFPAGRQHRDMKIEGVSHEDNSGGNARAAMVRRDAIEIRFPPQKAPVRISGAGR